MNGYSMDPYRNDEVKVVPAPPPLAGTNPGLTLAPLPVAGQLWPKVIGGVSLAFGLGALVTSIGNAVVRGLASLYSMWGWDKSSYMSFYTGLDARFFLYDLPTMVRAGLLIWAGATCWKCRRSTRWPHLISAFSSVALALFMIVLSFWPFISSWSFSATRSFFQVVNLVSVLSSLAYPVFVMYWFLRPTIRAQMREWEGGSSPAVG